MKIIKEATVVLAFTGPKGCGKTTAANYIASEVGGTVLAFAEPLKKMCMEAFELTSGQVYTAQKDEELFPHKMFRAKELRRIVQYMERELDLVAPGHGFRWKKVPANEWPEKEFSTPRQILQWVGSELIHTIYEPFHCKMLGSKIKGEGLFLIDDLRYVLEYDYLKSLCPVLRVIEIKGRKEKEKGKEEHSSESDWKKIKAGYSIDNSKKIPDFKDALKIVYDKIITNIEDDIKANPKINVIIDNILGDTNVAIAKTQTVRNGKFGFELQKQ